MWHLARALADRGHEVSLFAAPGSDPGPGCGMLAVRHLALSQTARSDACMPAATFMAEHHAYLTLIAVGALRRGALRPHPQPQPAPPPGSDGADADHPDADDAAHSADTLAGVGARTRRRVPEPGWPPSAGTPPPPGSMRPTRSLLCPNGIDTCHWPIARAARIWCGSAG
ncbi:MAG: hypothetical protein ABWY20_01460 [Mycobacterium sp.]